MRGKRYEKITDTCKKRITPADAGKTWYDEVWKAQREDHPRGCGENDGVPANFDDEAGSPPRMRGKLISVYIIVDYCRITPADAGKTREYCRHTVGKEDHPRGCGENQSSPNPTHRNIGSPPRMRGKPYGRMLSSSRWRITPADAGKTQLVSIINADRQDHPRGCGENSNAFMKIALSPGSPPRMRGKPSRAVSCGLCAGITPADAGKTAGGS